MMTYYRDGRSIDGRPCGRVMLLTCHGVEAPDVS